MTTPGLAIDERAANTTSIIWPVKNLTITRACECVRTQAHIKAYAYSNITKINIFRKHISILVENDACSRNVMLW